MEFSKHQKKIIKSIVNREIKDLNSFYELFLGSLVTEKIAEDIINTSIDVIKFPSFSSISNTQGVLLNERQIENIIDFIIVWKKLDEAGLIYTYESTISPYSHQYSYLIPLKPYENREYSRYNIDIYNLIKDYLNKVLVVTEELKSFEKKKFKTTNERNITRSQLLTIITVFIALAGVVVASVYYYKSYQLQKENFNLNLNPILTISIKNSIDSNYCFMTISNDGSNSVYDIHIKQKLRIFNLTFDRFGSQLGYKDDWKYIAELKPGNIEQIEIKNEDAQRVFDLLNVDANILNIDKGSLVPLLYYKISFKREPDNKIYSTEKYLMLNNNTYNKATNYMDMDDDKNGEFYKVFKKRFENADNNIDLGDPDTKHFEKQIKVK